MLHHGELVFPAPELREGCVQALLLGLFGAILKGDFYDPIRGVAFISNAFLKTNFHRFFVCVFKEKRERSLFDFEVLQSPRVESIKARRGDLR